MKINLGKTGRYPEGKAAPDDEGALRFAIMDWDGQVRINFGTPVVWLSMGPDKARDFARELIARADAIEGKK